MTTIAIQTNNLSRDFATVRAVDKLTMEVPTGSIFGFLGPNGAGKTTTIRLLLGLLEPTQGSAEVLGFNVHSQSESIREQCGALLEHNGLYERLSAEDNLEFYGRVWRISSSERRTRIKELLTHLDLWERRGEIVASWSKGMKQKLAIARTLLHRPQLVFFDEPTAGLDPIASASLHEDIINLVEREGATVFLTTHNLAEAEKLCRLVGVIRKGKLVALGPIEQLRARAGKPQLEIVGSGFTPQVLESLHSYPGVAAVNSRQHLLTIHLDEDIEVAPLVNLMVGAGVQIEELRRDKASLEKVFLELMQEEEGIEGDSE